MIEIHLPVSCIKLVTLLALTKAIKEKEEEETIKQLETMKIGDIKHSRGGRDDSYGLEVAGGTALHWAAYYGKVKVANKLIEKGASTLA